jgi:hypothetical protein
MGENIDSVRFAPGCPILSGPSAIGFRRNAKSVLPDDNFVADIHPVIEIDHVVVDQPEAAG